jgi:hypothetical protein
MSSSGATCGAASFCRLLGLSSPGGGGQIKPEPVRQRRGCHGRGSWTMVELENKSMTQSRREIRTRRQEINYPELGVQERQRLALNRMSSNE